jgi:hypothetical protein
MALTSSAPYAGAAMDLGLGQQVQQDVQNETDEQRKKRMLLNKQQTVTGITPFMGAFQSLLSPTGNQF